MSDAPTMTPEHTTQALVGSLNGEISRLQAELARAKSQARTYRKKKGSLQEQLDQARAQAIDWKQKFESSPDEAKQELQKLRTEARARGHRDAFDALYKDPEVGLNPKIPVEKLWSILGYQPEGEADPAAIKARLLAAKQTDDFLFVEPARQQEQEQPAGQTVAGAPPATGGHSSVTAAPHVTMSAPQGLPDPMDPMAGMGGGAFQPNRFAGVTAQQPGPGVARGVPDAAMGVVTVRQSDLTSPHYSPADQARIAEAYKKGLLNVLPG